MEDYDSIADSLAGGGMDLGGRPLAQSVFTPTGVRNKKKRGSVCVDMDSLAERTYSHGRRLRDDLDYNNGLIGDRSAAGHCARLVGKQVEFILLPCFERHCNIKGELTWANAIK
jgi:hypothetical protein